MGHEYLLSICMMVKDEEKNLRRCLEAMKSLIQKDDVELIIVDTGSGDGTPDIAREYTDKVFFHEWFDNFSEMRNITISYAKGLYILIIDADEAMVNPELLYEYVSDEKYRSYNTLSVKIKNFSSSGGFTVLPQQRVFKNDGTFMYQGAVHNQPVFKTPILNTEVYLDHYGYLFHDRELREKKFKRTAGILMKELEKDPNNIYYRFQLAKSYGAHRQKREAYEEIKKAYKLISGDTRTKELYIYIFQTYGLLSVENNEFDEAIRACREGIGLKPEYIDLYYILAKACVKSNRPEEALAAYEKYIELAAQYDNLAISADRSIEMCYLDARSMNTAYAYLFNDSYRNRDYEKSYGYARSISDDKAKAINSVRALLRLKKFDEVKEVYSEYAGRRDIRESVEFLIESESGNMPDDEKKLLQAAFSNGDDPYIILNRFRCAQGAEKESLRAKALREIDFNSMREYYADFLVDLDNGLGSVLSVLKKLKKSKIRQYVQKIYTTNSNLEEGLDQYALNGTVRDDDHNALRVFTEIAFVILYIRAAAAKGSGIDYDEQYYSIFKRYIEKGYSYIKTLYNPERLRLYYKTFEDQEDIFFIALNYAREASERGDIKAAINYFREAARANVYMVCYMQRYRNELFGDETGPGSDLDAGEGEMSDSDLSKEFSIDG
jgi:glycosyltransferase involved in cell wall biosynthesis